MLNKILILVASLALVACSPCDEQCRAARAESHAQYVATKSSDPVRYYQLEKLFERDGCTVYGFTYHGHSHTFFKCEVETKGVTQ